MWPPWTSTISPPALLIPNLDDGGGSLPLFLHIYSVETAAEEGAGGGKKERFFAGWCVCMRLCF
jgi:hypothetical protein